MIRNRRGRLLLEQKSYETRSRYFFNKFGAGSVGLGAMIGHSKVGKGLGFRASELSSDMD